MKSAGDDVSFTSFYIDNPTGHTREYANKLARQVTLAMKEQYARNKGCTCDVEQIDSTGCNCGAMKVVFHG